MLWLRVKENCISRTLEVSTFFSRLSHLETQSCTSLLCRAIIFAIWSCASFTFLLASAILDKLSEFSLRSGFDFAISCSFNRLISVLSKSNSSVRFNEEGFIMPCNSWLIFSSSSILSKFSLCDSCSCALCFVRSSTFDFKFITILLAAFSCRCISWRISSFEFSILDEPGVVMLSQRIAIWNLYSDMALGECRSCYS